MNSHHDILARVLAAEDHPHLLEEPEFREAKAAVDSSSELQEALDDARQFSHSHPRLMDVSGMPSDVRERIAAALHREKTAVLQEKEVLGPWDVRRTFAWAASLILLLAGVAVLSTEVLEREDRRERNLVLKDLPALDIFHIEVSRLVSQGMPLQEQSRSASQLVSWLGEQGMQDISAPAHLMQTPALGCAQFKAPFGKIGVVCFNDDGTILHLFMVCAKAVGEEKRMSPREFRIGERPAKEWSDGENLYILIPQEPETELPEIFL